MRFRRAVCVVNPFSGGGADAGRTRSVKERLEGAVDEVRVVSTNAPHHAAEVVRQAVAERYDLVAVYGGDGTVNEALQGLAGNRSPALLVLPAGTANVLAREVGLPLHPLRAASRLPSLVERQVALGLVRFASGDGRYFLTMCGAGLDAAIAARVSKPVKRLFGKGAYWLSGGRQFFARFPQVRLASDDGIGRACSLVVVSKSRMYGGGLVLTPGANLLSKRFEVARFSGTNRLLHCGYLLAGICSAASWWPGIEHVECDRVRVEPGRAEQVLVQVDGEVSGALPAEISMSSKSISLLLPSGYCRER